MKRWLPVLLSVFMLSIGCSTTQQASVPSEQELSTLESTCLSYHLEHHEDDEQLAFHTTGKVAEVEFTGYRISICHVEAGEALVGIKVESHKYIGNGPRLAWASRTDVDWDWQERWRKTKDVWVFIELVNKPNWILIYR